MAQRVQAAIPREHPDRRKFTRLHPRLECPREVHDAAPAFEVLGDTCLSVSNHALRAIRGVCVDKKAKRDTRLYDQIEELGRAQVFHPGLVDWALQIRLVGQCSAIPTRTALTPSRKRMQLA